MAEGDALTGAGRVDLDLGFRIERLHGVRVRAPGPDYWQGFLTADGAPATAERRFQFSPPWRTVYARAVETVLVRVQLDDGSVGWGEATCPIAPEVVVTLLNGFVHELACGPRYENPADLVDRLYDAQRCRGYLAGHAQDASAALDMAVHDALARRHRLPVCRLLDAKPVAFVPAYLSGARAPDRAGRIKRLEAWARSGSPAAKIFLRGDLDADLDEFLALRDAVPAIDWWAVDALWTYAEPGVAARARRAFGDAGVAWLECPMLPEDLAGHRRLGAQAGAPIALGEHFRTEYQLDGWLDERVVQVLQPDIGRTGFVVAGRLHAAARRAGIAVTPHMGGALDVMQAATLQFAAALGDARLPCEFQAGLAGRVPRALESAWVPRAGGFEVPDCPGLGVVVDEAALQAFVVSG